MKTLLDAGDGYKHCVPGALVEGWRGAPALVLQRWTPAVQLKPRDGLVIDVLQVSAIERRKYSGSRVDHEKLCSW